jgi:Fe-S cluster assembly protein SufD
LAEAVFASGRWLSELRSRGARLAGSLPWPTTQEEEWRRTSLEGLKLEELRSVEPDGREPAPPVEPAAGQAGAARFRGTTCAALGLAALWRRQGVLLQPITGPGPVPQAVAALLEGGLERADNRFAAWHLGQLSHGVFLYVPPGVEVSDPVFVDLEEAEEGSASFPHLAVVLGREARARVVLRVSGDAALVNAGLDAQVGDGASLELYQLQDLGPSSLYFAHSSVAVGRDAGLRSLEAHFGSRLVKTRIDCSLEGAGAESYLNGAFLAGAGQHMDLRTVQRHRSPKATSRALYKGAVRDSGRTIYQGLIAVSPGASGTDAYLSNKNLILNDGARADSIPSLRIDNNDVRCSHGSTTGRISPEELFYLASRGLAPAEARALLVLGFFDELLARSPIGEQALRLVGERLTG